MIRTRIEIKSPFYGIFRNIIGLYYLFENKLIRKPANLLNVKPRQTSYLINFSKTTTKERQKVLLKDRNNLFKANTNFD